MDYCKDTEYHLSGILSFTGILPAELYRRTIHNCPKSVNFNIYNSQKVHIYIRVCSRFFQLVMIVKQFNRPQTLSLWPVGRRAASNVQCFLSTAKLLTLSYWCLYICSLPAKPQLPQNPAPQPSLNIYLVFLN